MASTQAHRSRHQTPACLSLAAGIVAAALCGPQARAQFVCTTVGVDETCINVGIITLLAPGFGLSNASAGDNNIFNLGQILVPGGLSFGISAAAAGNNNIFNGGVISLGINSFGISAAGSNNTITNTGLISVASGFAISAASGTGTNTILNYGLIFSGSGFGVSAAAVNNVIVNAGTIFGTVFAVSAAAGTSNTLTSLAGSRIIGPIGFAGTALFANFFGGNYLYSGLGGAVINANGAPFAVSGGTIAVLDPTALALEDRALVNFTGGIASTLQDRFSAMTASLGTGAALGFAANPAIDGFPTGALAYASAPRTFFGKAPAATAPTYDTVLWASGFGGLRQQSATGNLQRARDVAFGGVLGIDRQISSVLQLGVFGGIGSGRLDVDFDIQTIDTNAFFAGIYGRWDRRAYYIDFALFGGGLNSDSTRLVANNLAPAGIEIATASFDGWFISPDITVGMLIPMGASTVTPKARVRYVTGSLDGYTEIGSTQGLVVAERTISDIEGRLGVEFARASPTRLGGTLETRLEASLVALSRLGDDTINVALLGQTLAFTTPGVDSALGVAVGGMLNWMPTPRVRVYTGLEGMLMTDRSVSGVAKGGVQVGL